MHNIHLAQTDEEIIRCYPVMVELRPHLSLEQFLEQVRRQRQNGYHLACLADESGIKAVTGYRFSEFLAWGKVLYVDDLVTLSSARSKNYGGKLFDWLLQQAKDKNCDQFHLDSGVQRFGAHRFYLMKRMDITSHHFAIKLK